MGYSEFIRDEEKQMEEKIKNDIIKSIISIFGDKR